MPLPLQIVDRAIADVAPFLTKPCPIIGALRCGWAEFGERFDGYENLSAKFLRPLRTGVRAIRAFESVSADLSSIDSPRVTKVNRTFQGDVADDLFFKAEAAWKEERFEALYVIQRDCFTDSVLSMVWDPGPLTNPNVFSAKAHRYASSPKLPDHHVAMLLIRDAGYDIPKVMLWAPRKEAIDFYRRMLLSCSFTTVAFDRFKENYGPTA